MQQYKVGMLLSLNVSIYRRSPLVESVLIDILDVLKLALIGSYWEMPFGTIFPTNSFLFFVILNFEPDWNLILKPDPIYPTKSLQSTKFCTKLSWWHRVLNCMHMPTSISHIFWLRLNLEAVDSYYFRVKRYDCLKSTCERSSVVANDQVLYKTKSLTYLRFEDAYLVFCWLNWIVLRNLISTESKLGFINKQINYLDTNIFVQNFYLRERG